MIIIPDKIIVILRIFERQRAHPKLELFCLAEQSQKKHHQSIIRIPLERRNIMIITNQREREINGRDKTLVTFRQTLRVFRRHKGTKDTSAHEALVTKGPAHRARKSPDSLA
jgi:hypothetical protein